MESSDRPLDGVRVLELGQLLAGAFAGTMLAYFGAEVVKVEAPDGDPLRTWREMDGDTSVWWRSLARNKRCVAIDLRKEQGRDLVRRLAEGSDVLVENFRPGTMEAWGLGPDPLRTANPRLVYARVSGFGQTGPDRTRAGFASVCEAAAGLRHLTGEPGRPPVRANLSIGDTLGGMHAVIGLLLAIIYRQRTGVGQVVDVALTESILNVTESVMPEFFKKGVVRQPSGPTITGVVPSNAYACEDGKFVVIGANTRGLFQKLVRVAGSAELAEDPTLGSNVGRVARAAEIDVAIEAWTRTLPSADVVRALEAEGVPASSVNDARAIAADPQLASRGFWESATAEGRAFTLPAIAPRLWSTPGRTEWAGPAIGAHTNDVLTDQLGLDSTTVDALRARGIVR